MTEKQQQLTHLAPTFETSDKSKTTEVYPCIHNVISHSNECYEKQENRDIHGEYIIINDFSKLF